MTAMVVYKTTTFFGDMNEREFSSSVAKEAGGEGGGHFLFLSTSMAVVTLAANQQLRLHASLV